MNMVAVIQSPLIGAGEKANCLTASCEFYLLQSPSLRQRGRLLLTSFYTWILLLPSVHIGLQRSFDLLSRPCYRPFPLPWLCYRPFLLYRPCYRPSFLAYKGVVIWERDQNKVGHVSTTRSCFRPLLKAPPLQYMALTTSLFFAIQALLLALSATYVATDPFYHLSLAVGPFCYLGRAAGIFYYMGLATGFYHLGLAVGRRPFLLPGPCYRFFLLFGPCHRPSLLASLSALSATWACYQPSFIYRPLLLVGSFFDSPVSNFSPLNIPYGGEFYLSSISLRDEGIPIKDCTSFAENILYKEDLFQRRQSFLSWSCLFGHMSLNPSPTPAAVTLPSSWCHRTHIKQKWMK